VSTEKIDEINYTTRSAKDIEGQLTSALYNQPATAVINNEAATWFQTRLQGKKLRVIEDDEVSDPSKNVAQEKAPLPLRCSMSQVIERYTLNEKQAMAFRIHASAHSRSFPGFSAVRTDPLFVQIEDGPHRLIISGEGGTGKSLVIQAVDDFIRSWDGRLHTQLKVAEHGSVAAQGGAIALCKSFGQREGAAPKLGVNAELLRKAHSVIIDEISMVRRTSFHFLSKAIQIAKGDRQDEYPFTNRGYSSASSNWLYKSF
jgi:hypothetical protein